jgi:GTP1/Obg family GTP-binding protein
MREKTKVELTKLAEIMISKYQISEIKGTNILLEYALTEARRNDIRIDVQSIRKYEKWLEVKCLDLQGHIDYMASQSKSIEEEVDDELEDDENFYDCYGDVIDDMSILQRSIEIISRFTNATSKISQSYIDQKFPDYSMFVVSEDGLMVVKGSYKGRLLEEIDEVNFKGAKRGWAKWCLENDKNLTDDDRDVFKKIMINQM